MSTWNVKCSLVSFAVTKDIWQYWGNIRYMLTFAQMLIVASQFWNSSPRQKKCYQCKFWFRLRWWLFLDFFQLFFVTVQAVERFFIPSLKNNFCSNIWWFSVFWYVLTHLVNTSDLLYWTVVLFLFLVLVFVCFWSIIA